jgi:hypothetical protein
MGSKPPVVKIDYRSAMSELQTYWKLSDSLDEGQFSTQSGRNELTILTPMIEYRGVYQQYEER